MSEELESGNRKKKKSVTQYASSVLKESSVSAVSGIVSITNTPRKVFRVIIFLILTAAFLYQCVQFFTFLFEYPSVVDVTIRTPTEYMSPAFTFCNNERVKRSKFCKKYPDRCVTPVEEFCKKHSGYCGEGETQVPKEEFLSYDFEYEDIFELGHELDGILVFGAQNDAVMKNLSLLRSRSNDPEDVSICYSANTVVDTSEEPPYIIRNPMDFLNKPKYSFVFNPEENDKFDPDAKTGIFFAVHSPFDEVNPFQKGYFMKPGKEYKITVYMQEEHLLTYPYKTDCINYTEIWINNDRSGPRSQEMCRHKCVFDFLFKCINCTFPSFLYPAAKEEICPRGINLDDNAYCDEQIEFPIFAECMTNCKEECLKVKYFTDVRERYIVRRERNNTRYKYPHFVYVDIHVEDTEIMTFIYRPQYQSVEAFSYIGGFIGIWLGVSLVQVSEFFESVFLIGRYFWRKRIRTKLQSSQ